MCLDGKKRKNKEEKKNKSVEKISTKRMDLNQSMISTPQKMKEDRRIRQSTVSPGRRYHGSVNEDTTPEGGVIDEQF